MQKAPLLALALLLIPAGLHAETAPVFYEAKPGSLLLAKQRIAQGDSELKAALATLLKEADQALKVAPLSVVQKPKPAPSGSKHDYYTLARYYWPNPKTSDGKPYVRRDGEMNPETATDDYDHRRLSLLDKTCETLALAWYFTGDEKYASHEATLLRTWFLDPETRMHPHLQYAQSVLGKNEGRPEGILEGRSLVGVADAALLLKGSSAWNASDETKLTEWFKEYHTWLLNSVNGKDERAAQNNHGTYFDEQATLLALVLGNHAEAVAFLQESKEKRIAAQISADGSQPKEVVRADGLGYSCFNLGALASLANYGEYCGVDLWNFQADGQRGIRLAIDYLLPFLATPPAPWPRSQKNKLDSKLIARVLHQASVVYGDERYASIYADDKGNRTARFHLLYVK
jgi:hypothetical protein